MKSSQRRETHRRVLGLGQKGPQRSQDHGTGRACIGRVLKAHRTTGPQHGCVGRDPTSSSGPPTAVGPLGTGHPQLRAAALTAVWLKDPPSAAPLPSWSSLSLSPSSRAASPPTAALLLFPTSSQAPRGAVSHSFPAPGRAPPALGPAPRSPPTSGRPTSPPAAPRPSCAAKGERRGPPQSAPTGPRRGAKQHYPSSQRRPGGDPGAQVSQHADDDDARLQAVRPGLEREAEADSAEWNAARRSVLLRPGGTESTRNSRRRSAGESGAPSTTRPRASASLRGFLRDLRLVNECLISGCPADRR